VAWFVCVEDGVELEEELGVGDVVVVVVLGVVVGVSVVDVSVVVGRVVVVSVPEEVDVSAVDVAVEVSVPDTVPVAVSVPESGNSVMLEEVARQISLTAGSSSCFFLERLVRPYPQKCEDGRTSAKIIEKCLGLLEFRRGACRSNTAAGHGSERLIVAETIGIRPRENENIVRTLGERVKKIRRTRSNPIGTRLPQHRSEHTEERWIAKALRGRGQT